MFGSILWTVLSIVVCFWQDQSYPFCHRLTFMLNQKLDQVEFILRYFNLFTRYRLSDLVKLMMWENIEIQILGPFTSQFIATQGGQFSWPQSFVFLLNPNNLLIPQTKSMDLPPSPPIPFLCPSFWVLSPGPLVYYMCAPELPTAIPVTWVFPLHKHTAFVNLNKIPSHNAHLFLPAKIPWLLLLWTSWRNYL